MDNKPVDSEAWTLATCLMTETHWQFGPLDLSLPAGDKDMPDVQLEPLCDIIFANLTAIKQPAR